MECSLGKFQEMEFPTGSSDAKYLSTLLVATIEDAKDRISQIQYIFCDQLFPIIELRSKDLQKQYSEASRAAEDAWKAKEKDLLLQIDELELEKRKILEENQFLKMQKKAEPVKNQEEDRGKLPGRQSSLEEKICELEGELRQKSKDIDEGMELQSKMLELIHSNTNVIMNKETQLRKSEEKSNAILEKYSLLDRKFDMLLNKFDEKTEEVIREKEKQQDLLETIERQASELSAAEQKLNELEKEKKLVIIRFEQARGTIEGLHEELRKKNEELEEGRVLRKQLTEQINLSSSEALKTTIESENEKKFLEAKVSGLREKVDQLQEELRGRGNEASCGRESCKNLLECVEQKSFELAAEKNRKQDIIDAYKRLKSQYNFLCSKYGLSVHSTPSQNRIEEENDSLGHIKKLATPTEFENKTSTSSIVTCNMARLKKDIMSPEKLDNENENKSPKPSTSNSRSTFISPHTKCLNTGKSVSLSGSKRSASHWRETRSHQNQEGPDPHDDFLDTPFENVRENMNKVMKGEVHLPVPVPKDVNFDCSDDETQDLNILSMPQKQQMEAPKSSTKGFKYVEPVRKKADREKLKGIECKQCKKFYDAVLPDDGSERNLRCEHHDGISRHRYKYAPPMTPEGFWNIGFESEM